MNGTVIRTLILKDWRLHRTQILISIAAGGIALGVIQLRGVTAFLIGAIWFISKMVSTVGMFLVPWVAMVIAGSALVLSRHDIPNGVIPVTLILFGLPLVGFCLVAGAALISESEGWTLAATVACNSSYGLVWYFIIRNPAINGDLKSPVPVWSAPVETILAGGCGLRADPGTHLLSAIEKTGIRLTNPKGNTMRYLCFLALMIPILSAQDGGAIYKERCASCHDAPTGRVPALSAIKAMSGEAVYNALTSGAMKTQAEGLTTTQIFALLSYIAPAGGTQAAAPKLERTCKGDAAFQPRKDAPRWNGWSTSVTNSRFQDAAGAGLAASSVPKLKVKWAFNLGDVTMARGEPTVIGNRVFIASLTGAVYSLDRDTGCTEWGFKAGTGIRAGVVLGDANGVPAIYFSDGSGTAYALNASSGALIWKIHPVDQYATIATAAPQVYKGVVYQAFSSFEEALGPDPNFECCTFRGSVVALDAATGKKLWQTFTIPEEPKPTRKNEAGKQEYGPSGAAIWSTPTIDEQLGVLYVATGDNYSDPPTNTSDAILAMDLKTGKLLWSKQLTQNDTFNNGCLSPKRTNCPEKGGPDFDFGQPPILVRLGAGKRALVIGQKSGMVHAVDPDQNGKLLWQTRAGAGGSLGGSQWGSAADGQKVYVAISDIGIGGVADPKAPGGFRLMLDPKKGGGLYALDLATGKIVWHAVPEPCAEGRTDCSPAQSAAVTAIPGVVFSGSVDGHLRAYSAATGKVLWDVDTEQEFKTVNGSPAHGGSMDAGGPVVAGGMLFVNSGYGQWGGMPGNVLLAFSVDGK